MNPLGGIKFLSIIVPIVLMYFSIKRYKRVEGEGFLTFGQGFMAGLIFSFIYGSLNAMLIYVYGLSIDGGFVDFFVQDSLEKLGEIKVQWIQFFGEDTYREMLSKTPNVDLGDLAWSDFQSKLFGGLILSLIMAVILRQNPPVFNDQEHAW